MGLATVDPQAPAGRELGVEAGGAEECEQARDSG
jgi:hypothetical protein